jgi:hypothetical protein
MTELRAARQRLLGVFEVSDPTFELRRNTREGVRFKASDEEDLTRKLHRPEATFRPEDSTNQL